MNHLCIPGQANQVLLLLLDLLLSLLFQCNQLMLGAPHNVLSDASFFRRPDCALDSLGIGHIVRPQDVIQVLPRLESVLVFSRLVWCGLGFIVDRILNFKSFLGWLTL